MGSMKNCRRYNSSTVQPPEIFIVDSPSDNNNNNNYNNSKKKNYFIRDQSITSWDGEKKLNDHQGVNANKYSWRRKGTRGIFIYNKVSSGIDGVIFDIF